MIINKLINKFKKAQKKGLLETFKKIFWNSKYCLQRFLNVKIVNSRYGVKLYSDFKDATFRFYYLSSYGFYYSKFLNNFPDPFIFIDVGANKGLYSILAAKNLNCKKVISFEPVPLTYEFLKKNAELNNVINKCQLHNLAISEKSEDTEISFDSEHSGVSSLTSQFKSVRQNYIKISTINYERLEDLFPSKSFNYILKVDVEGFERTVLNEIFKCNFSEYINNVYYEVDESWETPILIEKILRDKGFSNFKKIGNGTHYDIMATR